MVPPRVGVPVAKRRFLIGERMERKPQNQFIISEMTTSDLDSSTEMRLQSWLDTYPNEEYGVTRKWVEEQNLRQMTTEKRESRKERFEKGKAEDTVAGWVAKDASGKVIGATTPWVDEDGTQHVGSLYVDKNWHGSGVGSALMQKVVEWFDVSRPIVLGVASYNNRAKAFYRKWGFEEIPDSEKLFNETIPEVHMVRKGDKQ